MLAASAGGQIRFKALTRADIRHMCCHDGAAHESLRVPCWLSLYKLAAQVRCPVELLFMWVYLWRDALMLDGAASAVFENSVSIKSVLTEYLRSHSYPPSPRLLLQLHLKISGGSDADSNVANAGCVRAKRRCLPKVAEATPKAPAEAPAQAPALRAEGWHGSHLSIDSHHRRSGSAH